MGFLTGFGEGLSRSADLEHQANIAKQQDLTKANLELAKLLLGGTPEQQAQGLAIISDPSHPHRTDKDHPNLGAAKNLMQALGPGAASQSIASGQSPAGMAGMLSPDQSPLVQSGAGQMAGSPNIGDQGTGEPISAPSPVGAPPPGTLPNLPSPAPAPPLPPQPAAMTTNPPATQGGKISPAAAAPGAPPPAPPPQIAPAPPPPEPPPDMSAAIAQFEQAQPPKPGLNAAQQETYYTQLLKNADTLKRAKALQAAGASPEEIRATLAGREGTTVITAGMHEKGKDEDRDLKKTLAGDTLAQRQRESDARVALAKDRLKQDWSKHLDSLQVQKDRLAKSGGPDSKAEIARLTKLQQQGEKAIDGATEGISGIENLRLQYKLYTETPFGITTALEKAEAWNRYAKAVSSEGARMSRAMTAMTLPGNRGANEARVKAMEKELASLWAAKDPAEGNYRIDNIEHLIRTTEEQLRSNIEELAAHPVEAGKSVLPPPRPPKDLSGVAGGPGAPHAAAPAPGAKIAPRSKVQEYATKVGIPYGEAEKRFRDKGYQIQ